MIDNRVWRHVHVERSLGSTANGFMHAQYDRLSVYDLAVLVEIVLASFDRFENDAIALRAGNDEFRVRSDSLVQDYTSAVGKKRYLGM